MPGRILLATLLVLVLLGSGTAAASEGSQARGIGETLRPFAAAVPEIDQVVSKSVDEAGAAALAQCGDAATAVGGLSRKRRVDVATGLGLLQLGLDTVPATLGVLVLPLQATQDQLQELKLTNRTLRSARAARRVAIKRLRTLADRRESICPILQPWAAAGFPTTRKAPSFRRVRRANKRAASTIVESERAFDGERRKKLAAGAAALRRTGVSLRVTRTLTLSFRLPVTNHAVAFDPFKMALRRAAGGA